MKSIDSGLAERSIQLGRLFRLFCLRPRRTGQDTASIVGREASHEDLVSAAFKSPPFILGAQESRRAAQGC